MVGWQKPLLQKPLEVLKELLPKAARKKAAASAKPKSDNEFEAALRAMAKKAAASAKGHLAKMMKLYGRGRGRGAGGGPARGSGRGGRGGGRGAGAPDDAGGDEADGAGSSAPAGHAGEAADGEGEGGGEDESEGEDIELPVADSSGTEAPMPWEEDGWAADQGELDPPAPEAPPPTPPPEAPMPGAPSDARGAPGPDDVPPPPEAPGGEALRRPRSLRRAAAMSPSVLAAAVDGLQAAAGEAEDADSEDNADGAAPAPAPGAAMLALGREDRGGRICGTFGPHIFKLVVPGGGDISNATSVTAVCGRHSDKPELLPGGQVPTRRSRHKCSQNIKIGDLTEDLDDKMLRLKRWLTKGYAIDEEGNAKAKADHQAIRAAALDINPTEDEVRALPLGPGSFRAEELACLR